MNMKQRETFLVAGGSKEMGTILGIWQNKAYDGSTAGDCLHGVVKAWTSEPCPMRQKVRKMRTWLRPTRKTHATVQVPINWSLQRHLLFATLRFAINPPIPKWASQVPS